MKLSLMTCGKAVGSRVIDNHHFASYLDTSDQWIRERSGILTRHWVEDESTLDLARSAAEACLGRLPGLDRSRIRVLICASVTTDEAVPALSARLQEDLGLDANLFAFDLNAACSGYVYSLQVARSLLGSYPQGSLALLVGAEVLSRHTDMEDRTNCFLFGDGAGASLWTLEQGAEDVFAAKTVGNRDMLTLGHVEPIRMDGRAVFRFAVGEMSEVIRQVLAEGRVRPEEVDLFLLHQANQRIIDAIARSLELDNDRFPTNLDRYGNTSSASIGILMDELYDQGLLDGTKTLCLAGFGGGMSCGALLLKGHQIHVA
ncbi:MAG: beta-ketoacyl-ACP synthase 3 [Saccharofermentanales bacterium]